MKIKLIIVFAVFLNITLVFSAHALVTGLEVFSNNGQTFLTWDLIEGDSPVYRIYRSNSRIESGLDLTPENYLWEVNNNSVINQRKTTATDTLFTYCIEDTLPLDPGEGLFVHTSQQAGDYFYAVISVEDGIEDTTIIFGSGGNSLDFPVQEEVKLPLPVLQFEGTGGGGVFIRDYVHWGSNEDTDSVPAMSSYPSFPYNFRVWNVPEDSIMKPLRFFLHSGESFFTQRGRVNDDAVIISPDCPRRSYPLSDLRLTYWFGYNSNIGMEAPMTEGVNVNYHEGRMLYTRDWALRTFNIDPGAVYFTGGSYGACGSVLLSMSHPEEIAAIVASLPKLDFSDTTFMSFSSLVSVWGHPDDSILTSDGLFTYDRLNATWMIEHFGNTVDFPVMSMFFGINDSTMGWKEKVAFMNKAQEMRIGGAYFWDTSTHGFGGVREWSLEFFNRFSTLYRYRSDQSYPAISYLSINDDPGNGDPSTADSVGTYGGYVEWLPESIVDENEYYEVSIGLVTTDSAITLPADTATAVVTLRRLQNFEILLDTHYSFENIDTTTGLTIQSSIVKPDSFGLLTVEGVKLSVNGHRFVFEPLPDHFNYYHDPLVRGTVVDVTVDGTLPGEKVYFIASRTGAGDGPCYSFLGDMCVDILDPFLLGRAITEPNGIAIYEFTVPMNPAITTIYTQAVIRRGAGGANSAKSHVIEAELIDP